MDTLRSRCHFPPVKLLPRKMGFFAAINHVDEDTGHSPELNRKNTQLCLQGLTEGTESPKSSANHAVYFGEYLLSSFALLLLCLWVVFFLFGLFFYLFVFCGLFLQAI